MNSRDLAKYLVLGGVIAGLSAGTNLRAGQAKSSAVSSNKTSIQMAVDGNGGIGTKASDKHACKGLNSCKSHGNCKGGDNGCSGKNSCKGKGGCASKEYKHDCAGKNACKGQGQGGKNDCKGKSTCAVPKGEGTHGKGEGTHGAA
jgi:hypothetical protein